MTVDVQYGGFLLRLKGSYQEGQDEIISDNDNSTPGYSSSFEIESVEVIEGDLLGLILHIECQKKLATSELEELAIEEIKQL